MTEASSRSERVVVTGAAGHIGANLCRALSQAGRPLRLLVHRETAGLDGLSAERVRGDVLDQESLERAFAGAEVVYHLAAHISIVGGEDELVSRVNVQGTKNVVEACLQAKVRRLVHFSSIHALSSFPADRPISETNALAEGDGFFAYDRSKAGGERAVLEGVQRGLDAVIINPTGVIGPYDYKLSAMGAVLRGLAQRKLPALVPGGYDWVDARDVVQGALAAETKGRTGERYLLSGHWLSIKELALLVEEITGVRPPALSAPLWLARLGAPFVERYCRLTGKRPLYTTESLLILCANSKVSRAKATAELGYAPRPIRQTMEDTFAWLATQGLRLRAAL